MSMLDTRHSFVRLGSLIRSGINLLLVMDMSDGNDSYLVLKVDSSSLCNVTGVSGWLVAISDSKIFLPFWSTSLLKDPPTSVSAIVVDPLRSFSLMPQEMTWMVDTCVSTRFAASCMAASLFTKWWLPSRTFFSFRTSNWIMNRRNSSWNI